MLNMTSRLTIRLENTPDWNVDWLDNKPQLPRSKLNHTHFLPSEDDARNLEQDAMQYMMEFLVENYLVPTRGSPHPIQKSSVVPMKILFRDEKYTAETIEIISKLLDDANLSGDSPQARQEHCVVCTYPHAHSCTRMCTHMHLHVHARMHACTYTRTHTHTHTHLGSNVISGQPVVKQNIVFINSPNCLCVSEHELLIHVGCDW